MAKNITMPIERVLDSIKFFKTMPMINKSAWEGALNCIRDSIELEQRIQLDLTVEELKQMNGTPVFVKNLKSGKTFWMLAYPDQVCNRLGWLDYRTYDEEWIAYLYEFEEKEN